MFSKGLRAATHSKFFAALTVTVAALIIGCGGTSPASGGSASASATATATAATATATASTATATASTATASTATATASTATATASTATATASTATASTATASTATASTATASTASAATTGNGVLPANVIVYPEGTGNVDSSYNVNGINPDGTNDHPIISNVPANIALFAANPAVKNQYVVAVDPNSNGFYGIYLTDGLTLAGSTKLVSPAYTFVTSLAISNDATHIVYVATDSSGNSNLYSLKISGGTPVNIDSCDGGAAISPADSDTIAYSTHPGGTGIYDQILTRSLKAGKSGTTSQLTSESEDHLAPTFSRDGSMVAYQIVNPTTFNTSWIVLTFSGNTKKSLPDSKNLISYGAAFNSDGSKLAILGLGQDGKRGIYVQSTDGSAQPVAIKSNDSLLMVDHGTYWTSSTGRASGGGGGMSGATAGRRKPGVNVRPAMHRVASGRG